jgi:hypothetical protein
VILDLAVDIGVDRRAEPGLPGADVAHPEVDDQLPQGLDLEACVDAVAGDAADPDLVVLQGHRVREPAEGQERPHGG